MLNRFGKLPPNVQGALWLLGAGVFLSAMGVFIKLASQELHPFQVAFFRAFFGFLIIAPFALKGGISAVKTKHPFMHLCRGLIGGGVLLAMFYSVAHLPLADVTALSFTKPLFLIPLAVLFLGEKVRLRRTIATLVGFTGVIVMLRPGGETDPIAFVALGAAAMVAVITIFIKVLSKYDKPNTLVFWSSLILSLVVLGPALLHWRWPSLEVFLLMVALATVGTIGQSMLIRGYAVGEATAVTPFDYSRLIYAGVFGFLMFGEVPDIWTIAGALIIVASTIYIARREAKLKPGSRSGAATFDGPAGSNSPGTVRHGYPVASERWPEAGPDAATSEPASRPT
ncbi:MAG: DMT family transporter [Minwuia sp.]|uniref:DMT family transporter n=1 Tax=Minwuia sp. TaxID=2493630 RepID=UPI003A8BB618